MYTDQVNAKNATYGAQQALDGPKRETIVSLIADLEKVVANAYDNLTKARQHANSLVGAVPEAIANETPVGPASTLLSSLRTTIARLENVVSETHSQLLRIESALSE